VLAPFFIFVYFLIFLYASFGLSRSLKLGVVPGPTVSPGSCQPLVYTIRNSVDVSNFSWNDKRSRQGKESLTLTRSCLSPLVGDNAAPGYHLNPCTLKFGVYRFFLLNIFIFML
jgi:hypothetical protein